MFRSQLLQGLIVEAQPCRVGFSAQDCCPDDGSASLLEKAFQVRKRTTLSDEIIHKEVLARLRFAVEQGRKGEPAVAISARVNDAVDLDNLPVGGQVKGLSQNPGEDSGDRVHALGLERVDSHQRGLGRPEERADPVERTDGGNGQHQAFCRFRVAFLRRRIRRVLLEDWLVSMDDDIGKAPPGGSARPAGKCCWEFRERGDPPS